MTHNYSYVNENIQTQKPEELASKFYIIVDNNQISLYNSYRIYNNITPNLLDNNFKNDYTYTPDNINRIINLKNKTRIILVDSTLNNTLKYRKEKIYYNQNKEETDYVITQLTEPLLTEVTESVQTVDQWIGDNIKALDHSVYQYKYLIFLYPIDCVDFDTVEKYINNYYSSDSFSIHLLENIINREIIVSNPEFINLLTSFPNIIQILDGKFYEIESIGECVAKLVANDVSLYQYIKSEVYQRELAKNLINSRQELLINLILNYDKIMHLVSISNKFDTTIRNVKRLKSASCQFSDIED